MSSHQQQSLPVWVVKWLMQQNGRGRSHVAVFVPNALYANTHPMEAEKCEGTLYHVNGTPMFGFALNIRRNWNSAESATLESATRVAWIDQRNVWTPTVPQLLTDDTQRRSEMDKIALNVRPPGPTARAWIAVCTCLSGLPAISKALQN